MYHRVALALFLILFVSCSSRQQKRHSFYYWKLDNYGRIDSAEVRKIDSMGVEHFYIHMMDVDWSEVRKMPVPINTTGNVDAYATRTYTPVVFITNRVFEQMPDNWCDTLARKIKFKLALETANIGSNSMYDSISQRMKRMKVEWYDSTYQRKYDSVSKAYKNEMLERRLKGIQVDCDWTAKTKDKYFRFLRELRKQLPGMELSATVRLYPYKYRKKMGVPPVDRVVLMCYNLGGITTPQTVNSVFDLKELEKYLEVKDYPLPMEIALPVFGWYAWFRGPQFKGVIYETPELVAAGAFSKREQNNSLVIRDTVVQNRYLREGDILRMEYPNANEVEQAAALITRKIPNYRGIVFYHWHLPSVKRYENAIQNIYRAY
ncbi:hypothetical protein [Polluticoccus soli]|uniref:hypothetical protein n=1 Tax=Polluticoccus soli TaxID=3034150 RepID=UPI0023E2F386|nr:hypothetical protein [Flavipsychrobacter sp. JY13-12]